MTEGNGKLAVVNDVPIVNHSSSPEHAKSKTKTKEKGSLDNTKKKITRRRSQRIVSKKRIDRTNTPVKLLGDNDSLHDQEHQEGNELQNESLRAKEPFNQIETNDSKPSDKTTIITIETNETNKTPARSGWWKR